MVGRKVLPDDFIGIEDPLPTLTEFPVSKLKTDWSVPDEEARWDVAPESMYQLGDGSLSVIVLNASAKSLVGW